MNICSFLQKVENHEINFWNPNIQQHVTNDDVELLHVPSNYGVYLCLVLEATEIHHKILQRFARVVVYELSRQSHTAASLAQGLQGITLFKSKNTLEKQIEGYICAGNRYTHIAHQLGGLATLFFLPHGIGNSLWVPEKLCTKKNTDEEIQLGTKDTQKGSYPRSNHWQFDSGRDS